MQRQPCWDRQSSAGRVERGPHQAWTGKWTQVLIPEKTTEVRKTMECCA